MLALLAPSLKVDELVDDTDEVWDVDWVAPESRIEGGGLSGASYPREERFPGVDAGTTVSPDAARVCVLEGPGASDA